MCVVCCFAFYECMLQTVLVYGADIKDDVVVCGMFVFSGGQNH